MDTVAEELEMADADTMGDNAEGDVEEDEELEEVEEEGDEGDEGDEMEADAASVEKHPPVDVSAFKEIGNLASWTVSTAKPGCGIEALRSEDTDLFWQSDGPQPHLLNIHFSRLVAIAHIRLFLDFGADESYTPTKLSLLAGTSPHDLQEFAELAFEQPRGWIDVDLSGVGGRPSGGDEGSGEMEVLRAHLVQVMVKENHQNGKDTHIRGLQVFARIDDGGRRRRFGGVEDVAETRADVERTDNNSSPVAAKTKSSSSCSQRRNYWKEDEDWGLSIGEIELR
ncbi:MAG: anaphase promoting complex subunit doc1 [Sclerophora amabilis]|nr:MAG: anaphase promoting complex subunit doc1 [Sclerophora amabilis]